MCYLADRAKQNENTSLAASIPVFPAAEKTTTEERRCCWPNKETQRHGPTPSDVMCVKQNKESC